MFDISKIKIEIITKQNVPININNPVLNYTQNKDRKSDRLFVQVFYDDLKIGEGIILDFYKQFEVVEDFGIPQLKKLPNFLEKRRENAKLFVELFENHPDFIIQKNIDNSSWFGFSLIIKPTSKLKRVDVVKKLMDAKIDCRPIVTGNFTRNDVMKYFDYEIHSELKNADYLHENGLFVGNSQVSLEKEIKYLKEVL